MKNVLKTVLTVLALIFTALLFGLMASHAGYQITLYNFIAGNGTNLAPDFSYNITVLHRVLSVLYILCFTALAFFSGKRGFDNIYRGMKIYTALPFIGLVGYLFIQRSMKAGVIMLLTLIWGYPYFPLIITESSVSAIVTPMGIAMALSVLVLILAHLLGKKWQ